MTISATTQFYGLLGYPAKHSLSPIIQNGWMGDHGINAVYLAFEIQPDEFEVAVQGLRYAGLAGANVTSPFKARAAAMADTVSESVRGMGSANTLLFDGPLAAHSTDGEGLIADIKARAPGRWETDGPDVIIGAGGAATAIAYALIQAGRTDVRLINRTLSKAEDIVKMIARPYVSAWDWDAMNACLDGARIIIQATSRGLKGVDPLTLDMKAAHPDALVYDTVYTPQQTVFLVSAASQGFATLDGLGMLVGQGALGFQHWFGILPDIQIGLARAQAALLA